MIPKRFYNNVVVPGLNLISHPDLFFLKLRTPRKSWYRLIYHLQRTRFPKRVNYYPLHIDLEISKTCNQKCIMCFRMFDRFSGPEAIVPARFHDHKTGPDFMDIELIRFLVPYLRLADGVNTLGLGEALLHPQFDKVIELLKQARVNVNIQTNANLLTSQLLEFFAGQKVDSIMISLHGYSATTIQAICPGADPEKLFENLMHLKKLKQNKNLECPVLGFYYVAMKSNIKELPDFLNMAAKVGAKFVVISHLVKFGPPIWQESLEDIQELTGEIFKKAEVLAKQQNIQLFFSYRSDYIKNGNICTDPWTTMHIHANNDVCPCGFSTRKMGNLHEHSIFEIWNSEPYQQLRSRMISCSKYPECSSCLCFSRTSAPDNMVPAYNEFLDRKLSLEKAGFT